MHFQLGIGIQIPGCRLFLILELEFHLPFRKVRANQRGKPFGHVFQYVRLTGNFFLFLFNVLLSLLQL